MHQHWHTSFHEAIAVSYRIWQLNRLNHISIHRFDLRLNLIKLRTPFLNFHYPRRIYFHLIDYLFDILGACGINLVTLFIHFFQTVADAAWDGSQFGFEIDDFGVYFHLEFVDVLFYLVFGSISINPISPYHISNLVTRISLRLQIVVNIINLDNVNANPLML